MIKKVHQFLGTNSNNLVLRIAVVILGGLGTGINSKNYGYYSGIDKEHN